MSFILLFLVALIGFFILILFKLFRSDYLSIYAINKFIALNLIIAIIHAYALLLYFGLNIGTLPLLILYIFFSYCAIYKYTILKVYILKNKVSSNSKNLPLQSSVTGKDALLYKLLLGGTYISMAFILNTFGDITVYSVTGSAAAQLNLNGDLQEMQHIVTELARVTSQLNTFITQFHAFVNQAGINVVTDTEGALGVDVLQSVPDSVAANYANRVNVFDSLIHDRVHAIEEFIARGSILERQILISDNNYVSQLSDFRSRLAQLISSYGHLNS